MQVLLKTAEAQRRLGVGRTKLYELMKSGELPSVRIGTARRVPESAVEEYITRLTASPVEGK